MSGDVHYDHIVIGGGTAGSVLAARLSEERDRRVLLLEAGPDYAGEVPAALRDVSTAVTSGYNWDLQASLDEDEPAAQSGQRGRIARVFQVASGRLSPGRTLPRLAGDVPRVPYPLGKVVGGGSAVNGGLALHARVEDYAAWTAAGNDEWSWERAQPFVARMTRDEDGKPALPMETPSPSGLSRCQGAFLATCEAMGRPRVDLRQGTAGGVGPIPKNTRHGQRVSASMLYLTAARRRSNLTIRSGCLVDRLILAGPAGDLRATGVEALLDGRRCRFSGGHVTLSAGAVHSPAILLRSGIGAAEEIVRAGGRPRLHLPGVGKGLQDHPAVTIWAVPSDGACLPGEMVHQLLLQERSSSSATVCDLQLFMLSSVPTRTLPLLRDAVGSDLALGIAVVVATPRSRGRVEIVDLDPATNPRIYLNCLREAADLCRMREGLRLAWDVLHREQLRRYLERVVLWSERTIDSDPLTEAMARRTVRASWHPVGTLRMGPQGDAVSVVDQHGRLQGCRNVRVADASVMPAIPSVPTNLTCMLIAERIAADLRGQGPC